VDVRVVAATNQDLERLVAQGRFREDLYYRLNVILIPIPDLSERAEDIPLLIEHFVRRFNQRMGRNIQGVTEEAMAALLRHGYPGNVRELENMIEHAFVVSPGPLLHTTDLPPTLNEGLWPGSGHGATPIAGAPHNPVTPWSAVAAASEREAILRCLQRHQWSLPRAARELGMHRTTLWRKVRRLRLRRP
jgi:DNA-binding NtrC family response regulator